MKKIFIADDGKVFDSEYECLKYELYLKHKTEKMAVVADGDGNIIPFDECYLLEDAHDSRFDEVRYIYAETQDQYDHLYEAMYMEYGWDMPNPDRVTSYPAAFYYDDNKDKWVDFAAIYSGIMSNKEIFERMKESLS